MRTVPTCLLLAALSAPGFAQAPTSNLRADSAFTRSEWSTALTAYLELVKADSTKAPVWFRIGIAQHGLEKYSDAVRSLTKARQLGAAPFGVELRLARSYAKLGDRTNAFTYLDSLVALAGPGVPLASVRDENDFAALKSESRFTTMLARLDGAIYPCHAMPEAKQFDFWIGQWDVAPWSGPPGTPVGAAGFNDVHPILEQCVVFENWRGAGGREGKSFNYFDTNQKKWRQVWVADGGGSLDYAGEFRDGAMRFEGWSLNAQGARMLQKLTFTPFGRDTVRQTFEASADGGKTWNVTFDGRYVRRKQG